MTQTEGARGRGGSGHRIAGVAVGGAEPSLPTLASRFGSIGTRARPVSMGAREVRASMIRRVSTLSTLAIATGPLGASTVPVDASGSHSKNKSFSTCAYTIEHHNGSRAVASTQGNSKCYWATVRLRYRFGGETVWGPSTTWYGAVWYYGPTTSTTVKSTHRVRHYPSMVWSSTVSLY